MKLAKAEREFASKCRIENGRELSDTDLDPEYGNSRGPNHEHGMNIRCQLFALSKDPVACCIGLLRHLGLKADSSFGIARALAKLSDSTDRPFATHLPVRF